MFLLFLLVECIMPLDQALSVWHVVDPVGYMWTCSTLLSHHNNRPVWLFECAILCVVCFTWARQWLHLASLLFLRPALSPWHPCHATPCPQSGLALHLFSLLGQLGLDSHCWPHPRPNLTFSGLLLCGHVFTACYSFWTWEYKLRLPSRLMQTC